MTKYRITYNKFEDGYPYRVEWRNDGQWVPVRVLKNEIWQNLLFKDEIWARDWIRLAARKQLSIKYGYQPLKGE